MKSGADLRRHDMDHVEALLDRLACAFGIGAREPGSLGRAVDRCQIVAEAQVMP